MKSGNNLHVLHGKLDESYQNAAYIAGASHGNS